MRAQARLRSSRPYRYILQPVVDYVLTVERETDYHKVCVLVPELVVRHWWESLLHNRRADLLKVILLLRGQPAHYRHQHSLVSRTGLTVP